MAFIHRATPGGFADRDQRGLAIGCVVRADRFGASDAGRSADSRRMPRSRSSNMAAWRPHPRFGEVWVPGGSAAGLAALPSTDDWVYTDEWGWYWVSDDVEADWGWVVLPLWPLGVRTGIRLVLGARRRMGDRHGSIGATAIEYVGWAPLPIPMSLIETYELQPAYWVFVPTRYIAAHPLALVQSCRRIAALSFYSETRIVNRTVPVHGARTGGQSRHLASIRRARERRAGRQAYRVRPRVLRFDAGVAGAVQVRREDLRDARGGGVDRRGPADLPTRAPGTTRRTWRPRPPRRNFRRARQAR